MKLEISRDEAQSIERALLSASVSYADTKRLCKSNTAIAGYWARELQHVESLRRRVLVMLWGEAGRVMFEAGRESRREAERGAKPGDIEAGQHENT